MANNCKAVFVNNTPLVCTVTDNGDGTYTFNNHIDPPVTWSTGGADTDTSIVFNQVLPNGDWEFNVVDVLTNTVLTTFTVPAPTISIIDNGDNTFTYIDVAGNPTVIAYEHTLVDNNDGTFTFTQPDGTPTTIDVCKLQQDSGCAATMVDNGDGTYTYTDINGVSTTFTGGVANVLTTITNTVIGHKIADYTDENGGITPIYETISTLVNNGDGTATFTNEDGAVITFPIGGVSIVDNTDGTYLVTLADGSTITIGDTSISTLVDNGDNTYTYTDETGVATIFDVTGVLTTITNTIVGNKIADYTDEAGGVTPINESITSFASITDGYQFTSEDGTVYPFTFTFDNTTPSAPQLLVNYGATIVATIPLNSYDVNIATTGGFALNPLTDVITITETDGETHTIDLSYLRSTLTSTDGSVQSIISINPDGSTNYDLGVKSHSNETQAIPYTGVELPTTPGVNIGDTNSTQFSDGTVVNYTWDGTTWIPKFVESWGEKRICLNTATPPFITTVVTGQTDVGLYFNYDGNPFDITSFKINGNELLTSTINVYDAGSNYIYTNQLVSLFSTWMTTNGYSGTIDDDIDGNGGVLFNSLSGGVLTFEIITDEGGIINTYTGISNLITTLIPADPNNPTITEVEAWKNANLSLLDQQNGTTLTYFVPGDGGSCDVPDYTWTLNKGSELITLDNKRVFNTKTVYVDAGSGSDVTGRRGYREYPFKTLNAAIPVLQDYDLLYVFPGDYTSSINTNKIINIYCEDGVNWLYTATLTSAQVLTQPTEVSWRFDKLYTNNPNIGLTGPGLTAHNYGVHLKINKAENVNYFGALGSAPNFRSTSLDVIESYNSGLTPITLNNVYPNPEISIKIHNVYKTTPAVAVGRGNSENTISNINFDNVYWETNGASNSSNFAGIFYGTDVNTHNKITTFKFNSVKSTRTPSLTINPIFMSFLDAQIIGPGNLASSFFRSFGVSNGDRVTVDVLDGVFETHTIGHSFYPVSRSDCSYRFTIKGRQKNGLAFYTTQNVFSNNNEIYVNLDVVTNEHAAVYIGLDNTTLNPLSTIYISGRIKTTRAGFPCIILGNNQNNRIVLKDLTLINDGTVSPIMINSANPENITIQNVKSNSLITDVNIVEVAESITRNTNIN
jgi:hypothetical protein